MKKLVFIIPYFGKFNNYFQLFLNSCSLNEKVNWIIITDDEESYEYPPNIKVIYMKFKDLKIMIQKKFDFKISLERPYKLCDYRSAYGYLFQEHLDEFEYWGYCDTDMLFGNLEKILFPLLDKKYDKLFFLGHCSIYKNTIINNKMFKEKIENKERYKEVYQSEKNLSFDEEFKESINNIFLNSDKKILLKELEANIYMKSSKFRLVKYDFKERKYKVDKKQERLFIYDNGNIIEYFINNGELKKEEYLYIHLQSRKMEVKISNKIRSFKIIPNSFEIIKNDLTNLKEYKKEKKFNYNLHYFLLRYKNLKIKYKTKFSNLIEGKLKK